MLTEKEFWESALALCYHIVCGKQNSASIRSMPASTRDTGKQRLLWIEKGLIPQMWRKGWHSRYSFHRLLVKTGLLRSIHSCKSGPRNKQEIHHPLSVPMGVERSFLTVRNAGHRALCTAHLWLLNAQVNRAFRDPTWTQSAIWLLSKSFTFNWKRQLYKTKHN